MITNNRLDKSFGPVGASAGVFLFISGIIITYFYITGLILILIGAFVGFTFSSTFIDYDKKRIKFSNNIFGFIRTGKWIQIEPEMKIGVRKSNIMWRSYSMGNKTLDIANNNFRIILFDSEDKEIMEIKKTDLLDNAKVELENLSNQLGLNLI